MILVRTIMQAKFGKAGELAKLMKESTPEISQGYSGHARVLTDLSGPFDTVVLEIEAPSLSEWQRSRDELFASPEFRESFGRTADLIIGGRAEFFTIE